MNGRKNQVIFIEKGRTRLIACSVGRIECELGEEALARWISARDLLELAEIGAPCRGILMDPLEMWFIPEAGTL